MKKNFLSALLCALSMPFTVATHAATVTTPQTTTFNGLAFSGNGTLTFSPDLIGALTTGPVTVIGYNGSPAPVTGTSLTDLISPVLASHGSIFLGNLPGTAGPVTLGGSDLQLFLDALKLAKTPTPTPGLLPGLVGLNVSLPPNLDLTISLVPELGSFNMMGIGLVALAAMLRRTKHP